MALRLTTHDEMAAKEGVTSQVKRCVQFAEEISYFTMGEENNICCPRHPSSEAQRCCVRVEAELLKPKGLGMLLKNCFDENDKTSQKHINAFSRIPGEDYPRGLELYLSRQHREERDEIHRKVIQGVLRRQKALKEAGTHYEVMCDKLRSISKKHSRSSRVFARRLGVADARAARDGDDFINALVLVKKLNQGNAKMVRRMDSMEDMSSASPADGSQRVISKLFGLSFITSQQNVPTASRKFDRSPLSGAILSSRSTAAACSEVIQDALDLLGLGSEGGCSSGDVDVEVDNTVLPRLVAKPA